MYLKKIAFVMSRLGIGGMERAFIDFVNGLDFTKYKVDVYLTDVGYIWDDALAKEINVIPINKNNILYKIRATRKIAREIRIFFWKKKKYDYASCFCSYEVLPAIITKRLCKNNSIWIHSDFEKYYTREEFDELNKKIKYKEFGNVIGCSHCVMKSVKDRMGIYEPRAVLIRNIIDGDKAIRFSEDIVDLDMPKDTIRFIHVGRHEEKTKAISKILEAFKKAKEDNLKFELILIGDGPEHKMYKEMAHNFNIEQEAVFIGFDANPYKYMKISDALILSSNHEGQGLVLYEAAILNKYIITTDVADVKVDIDGKYGEVVDATSGALYNAIKNYIEKRPEPKEIFDYKRQNEESYQTFYSII